MTIAFNSEKCTGCGLCVANCSSSCLINAGEKDVRLGGTGAALCLSCGQCEAICPTGALKCLEAGVYPALPDPRAPGLTAGQLDVFLTARRSARHFREEPVDRATIEGMLDTVRYAPSAGNYQNVRWIVISGRERVAEIADVTLEGRKKMLADSKARLGEVVAARYAAMVDYVEMARRGGKDPICRHAPHLVVAAAPADSPFRQADTAIALAWFELAAYARGLGTCWAGGVQLVADEYPPLRKALGIPDGYASGYVMMLGHPRYRFHSVPPRKPANVTWVE